ncbi:hypothetical protein G5I_13871 [Acromyrmex echinatior]|uniref:Uncharacterized protein n=1 Tax=Acromyrmex echinatior TaxID=103372 RepID=F4X666_ACREC|nr:hypothetical protein G5I_13871 [Acromyrmex echinatior]
MIQQRSKQVYFTEKLQETIVSDLESLDGNLEVSISRTTSLLQIMETMGRRIGRNAVQFTAESDSQRYNQVNIRAQHAREACISRSLAKNHQMEENLEQEGSLYGPGIDDDINGEIIVTAESCVACTADYMTVKWRDFPIKLL